MAANHHFLLLVEGDEDKRIVPQLVEANGHRWGETSRNELPLVLVRNCGGIDAILEDDFIATTLKQADLKACGILVDANADPAARWAAVRARCASSVPDLPAELPTGGAVGTSNLGVRVGIWLMPDNSGVGMIETFLQRLRRDEHGPLLAYAAQASDVAALTHQAPFRQTHRDKAIVHTWLAWQDPPGRQLHQAVMEQIFDANSPTVAPFMRWFRDVYGLADPGAPL